MGICFKKCTELKLKMLGLHRNTIKLGQNCKTTTTTKSNIKILARNRNRTLDLLFPSWMRYLWTTELTESIDCCQTF